MIRFTLVTLFLLVSCGSSTTQTEGAPAGTEGGACHAGGHCDGLLACASDICVRPPNSAVNNTSTTNTSPNNTTSNAATNNTSTSTNNTSTNNTSTNNTSTNNATIGANPPACVITAPTNAMEQPYISSWDLAADGTDPEDGVLPAAQIRWESDLAGALGTGASLSVELSPPGMHTIRCVATDADGNEGSAEVTVTVLSPIATIAHPGGEDRGASEPMGGIPFTGSGMDFEDGAMTGPSLQWTSDLDGAFGQGIDFRAQLSEGRHTITLTATDSDGNVGTDTLTFNVVP